jgi:hypothetical protein
MQNMIDGNSGITVNWTAMQLGRGCLLASNAEYRAFQKASTKEKDDANLNPTLQICVDHRSMSEEAQRLRRKSKALRRGTGRPVHLWRRSTAS